MALNKGITKHWIQFLKNNQIVRSESDPTSGKLAYKRKVTTTDLVRFLESNTDFDEDTIYNAVYTVLTKNGNAPARLQGSDSEDDEVQVQPRLGNPPNQQQKKSNDDAEDVEYTDVPRHTRALSAPAQQSMPKARGGKKPGVLSQSPDAIRKRAARAKKRSLTEDFVDQPIDLSEKDVKDIFNLLQVNKLASADNAKAQSAQQNPEEKKKQDVDKLKALVKKSMSPGQRKALWQALQAPTLQEAQIARSAVQQVFKDAAEFRTYSALKNDKIDINILQKDWKKSGFSLDTEVIGDILHAHGFSAAEIHEVFDQVLGDGNGYQDEDDKPEITPAIAKIAEYAKEHNLTDELLAYMQQEFGEELNKVEDEEPKNPSKGMFGKAIDWAKNKFGRTATVEDVRHIFTAIVLKERTQRHVRIKEEEKKIFGRSRK